jgi:hypothetical protein
MIDVSRYTSKVMLVVIPKKLLVHQSTVLTIITIVKVVVKVKLCLLSFGRYLKLPIILQCYVKSLYSL